jgi:uncharacterized membrane protein YkvA (DUF1232 family)
MFMRLAVPLLLFLAPRFLPHILRFARLVWRLSFDRRVPLFLRLLLPLAIVFAVSPIDLVRDTVPVLGRFDDLILIAMALLLLVKLSPKEVVDEHNGVVPPSNRPEDTDPDKVVDGTGRVIDDK